MNIAVCVYFQIMFCFVFFFSEYTSGVGLLDHRVGILVFSVTFILFYVVAVSIYISTNKVEVFSFLHNFSMLFPSLFVDLFLMMAILIGVR